MSYWVSLCVKSGPDEEVEVFDRNYTSNCAPMWRAAGCDLAEFDGRPAVELAQTATKAAVVMLYRADEFKAMNPPNGWGDSVTAREFLMSIAVACRTHSYATVRVSH